MQQDDLWRSVAPGRRVDLRPTNSNDVFDWSTHAPCPFNALPLQRPAHSCPLPFNEVPLPRALFYATSIAGHEKSVERSAATRLVPGESGRAILTTILGEFVLPHEQAAWTQSLVGLLGQFDVSDKAARQTIARLRDQGWLTSNREGRQTRWQLTQMSRDLLTEGADRIYQFGQVARPWNGTWLVLLARVPETDRNLRYRLSVGLRWAGFGTLGNGLWISPWTEREPQAAQLTAGLGIDATSFRAELGQLGSGPELVDAAWDLATLKTSYEGFLADTAPLNTAPSDSAAALTALVHRWRQFPSLDPDLPASLLPTDWPGQAAANRFAELRRALVDPARLEWLDTEAGYTPKQSTKDPR